MTNTLPRRGEIWFVAFDPAPSAQGHEQAYPRPALIVSEDAFTTGASDLAIVLPITRTSRGNPLHVVLTPPEGGVRSPSIVLCDQMTTISCQRLQRRLGAATAATMLEVGKRLRTVLGI